MLETTWEHIQGEDTGTMYTGEQKWINRIYKWKEEYPDQVDIRVINQDGSLVVHIPYRWFKMSPSNKRELTDEQKQNASERLSLYRKSKTDNI